jgi:acylphosphatase
MIPSRQPAEDKRRTVRVRITGRVQGVCYRAWTEENASVLGLHGWVRNLRDGAVEALFAGPSGAVDEMLKRCWSGPYAAKVEDVNVTEPASGAPAGFIVLPTA